MSRERFNIGSIEGAPRSGKGKLAEHFANRPEVAKDETGADYRAVTKALLEKGTLDPEMDKGAVNKALARTATADIVELAKNSHAIQAEHGLTSLYAPDVANTVHHVAQHQELRTAVKAGFQERIRTIRDAGDHELLIVDGRNLEPVIQAVEDTELVMRLYTDCSPEEAAIRECLKNGITIEAQQTPEGQAEYQAALARIINRRHEDQTRPNDAVRVDENAVDYWNDPTARTATAYAISEEWGVPTSLALQRLVTKPKSEVRVGVGALARRLGRQIYFDTDLRDDYPEDPIRPMLDAADTLLDESLSTKPDLAKTIL
jgi:cytidylate kinase